jgi:multidrug efflux pump subunit AcrB
MRFVDLPIEQMSVTGLIVALGIMVDNSIVMVDTVDRYKRRGYSGLQATFNAVAHLWKPLLGSTLTTILTFMPIVALEGSAGEFIGGISITVIASLIGSYLISHLIVAGFAGRLLTRNRPDTWINEGIQLPTVAPLFTRSILWGIENPKKIIAIVSIFPLLGFYFGSQLPESFFPPSDRDMINFEVYLSSSSSIDQTQALTERITASVLEEKGVKRLHWFIGGNAPSFYYNLMQRRDNSQYYAQAMLTADNFEIANRLVPLLQRKLDDEFPEAQIIIRRLEQGPPFSAPVEVRLTGDSFEALKEQGEELRRRFLAVEDVVHVHSTLIDAAPKLWLALDENKVAKAGLTLVAAAGELQSGIDGVVAGSILEQNQSLPVRVQSFTAKRGDIELVNSWLLSPGLRPTGVPATGVPVTALGEVKILPALSSIPRRDSRRVNTIEVYIRDGVLPAVVLKRIQQQLENDPLSLPAGFHLEYGGEEAERDSAVGGLLATVGPLLVLLVIAVVMSFNSFRISSIIFVVALQSAGLGMLALSFSGWPFGFTSIIGLMGLIGLAINAAIIILAELKSSADATRGDSNVIVQCVLNCSRHIVSTTITTVMGFMPLLLDGGAFWPPFAVVIAGGTVLATTLSFYFVPVVFSLMTRRRQFEVVDVEYELAAV